MTAITEELHRAFLRPLGDAVLRHSSAGDKAKYPVEGLEVTDEGVRLGGVPFAQASQAERLRASVAIGAAANPELRVMLVRDGALLDKRSMQLLEQIAAEHDIQTWTEVVGDREECTVIISDGYVGEALGDTAETHRWTAEIVRERLSWRDVQDALVAGWRRGLGDAIGEDVTDVERRTKS